MANNVTTVQGHLVPISYTQITNVSAAVGISAPDRTAIALIQAEGDVRWRDDGVDPTSTVGQVLYDKDTLIYSGDMSAIKFIEVSSANLNVTFYKNNG